MTSSEPATPRHEHKVEDKWQMNSCSDIDKVGLRTGDEEELEKSPIRAARWKALQAKRDEMSRFLATHPECELDECIDTLRTFATTPGGLIDDEFRAIIWPVLARHLPAGPAHCDDDLADDATSLADSDFESALSEVESVSGAGGAGVELDEDIETLKLHKEWRQVELDVHRTLARFPPTISETSRASLQERLIPLIVRVLSASRNFNYYQGFHDLCLTLVLVVGVDKAYSIALALACRGSFRDYLVKTLEQSVLKELDLMYVILSKADPQLEKVLRGVQLGSLFALSWPLTWFSHSLHHYHQIVRCFDSFLASPPLFPIYLCSAVVLYRKQQVLATEREMPFLHHCLNNMPHELPLEALLSDAAYLTKLMPPSLLRGRYSAEYKKVTEHEPLRKREVGKLQRYSLQFFFVAGTVSAAASYLYMSRLGLA